MSTLRVLFWGLRSTLEALESTLETLRSSFYALGSTLRVVGSNFGGPQEHFGSPKEHFRWPREHFLGPSGVFLGALKITFEPLGSTLGVLGNTLGTHILGPHSPTRVPLFPSPANLWLGLAVAILKLLNFGLCHTQTSEALQTKHSTKLYLTLHWTPNTKLNFKCGTFLCWAQGLEKMTKSSII